MSLSTVVITDCDIPAAGAIETLKAAGHTVRIENCRSSNDIVAAAPDATALIVQWAPVTAETLEALPSLKIVSRLGIGYDMIDVAAATRRGVAVANTPSYCIEEVAAHTLAMIMSSSRGLFPYNSQVVDGGWAALDKSIRARRPSATIVAVIGFGRIGSLVADQCKSLGFRVLVRDPGVNDGAIRRAGHQPVDFATALELADIVSLHAPLTEETRHLINQEKLVTDAKTTRHRQHLPGRLNRRVSPLGSAGRRNDFRRRAGRVRARATTGR